jgi:hypothetical protein
MKSYRFVSLFGSSILVGHCLAYYEFLFELVLPRHVYRYTAHKLEPANASSR